MTISQEGWNWFNFVPECFLYEAVLIFCNLARWPPYAITKNSTERENDNFLTLNNHLIDLMDFD